MKNKIPSMTGSTGKDKINNSFSSRYGIYKKALLLFLSISIVPVLIFGAFTLITLDSVSEDIVEKVELSIDKKVRDAMELQAVLTAESVVRFLKQREGDLGELKDIPPTDQNYLRFSRYHRGNIWIRGSKNDAALSTEAGIETKATTENQLRQGEEFEYTLTFRMINGMVVDITKVD